MYVREKKLNKTPKCQVVLRCEFVLLKAEHDNNNFTDVRHFWDFISPQSLKGKQITLLLHTHIRVAASSVIFRTVVHFEIQLFMSCWDLQNFLHHSALITCGQTLDALRENSLNFKTPWNVHHNWFYIALWMETW